MQRKIPPARCDCGGSQEVWDQVLHRVPRFAPSNYQGYQQGVPFFWQVLLHGLGRLPPDAVSTALNIPLLFILHNLFLINVKKLVYAFKTTILNRTKNGRRNIPQDALLVEKTPEYLNTLGAPQAIAKVNIKKSSRQKQENKRTACFPPCFLLAVEGPRDCDSVRSRNQGFVRHFIICIYQQKTSWWNGKVGTWHERKYQHLLNIYIFKCIVFFFFFF